VRREAFFLGQWLGVAVILLLFVLGLVLMLAALLQWRGIATGYFEAEAATGSGTLHWRLLLAALLQVGRLWVLAAFVFLLGSFARGSLFVISLSFLFLLIGQMIPAAGAYEAMLDGPGYHAFRLVTACVPNLGAFTVDGGELLTAPLDPKMGMLAGYAGIYVALYLGLGACAFSRRAL
jgi:hypothetical protein